MRPLAGCEHAQAKRHDMVTNRAFHRFAARTIMLAATGLPSTVFADEVICHPLPTDSVRFERFINDRVEAFHVYFPPTFETLEVDAATVEFSLARSPHCATCPKVVLSTLFAGSRVRDDDIDVFEVAFRLPAGTVESVAVSTAYSGACTTKMVVVMKPEDPSTWPAPFQRSDFPADEGERVGGVPAPSETVRMRHGN